MSVVRPGVPSQGAGKPFPWSHIIGYLLSVLFTIAAFEMVIHHTMKFGLLLLVILILAVIQILVQLLFFMHVTERHGPRYHIIMFSMAMFFVFVFVGSSIWIMTFSTPN